MESPRVVCLGEALVDRLGPLGGNPALDQPVDDRLGGAPANVACGLARLGTLAALLGRLGGDAVAVLAHIHISTMISKQVRSIYHFVITRGPIIYC